AETVIDRDSGCPEMPGGLGWLPAEVDPSGDGALLVVDCLGKRILAVRNGLIAVQAEFGTHFPFPANDMHVDPDGTAWVGGYGFDPMTGTPEVSPLLRVGRDGSVHSTSAQFVFPNGCERDAAGGLVVAETFADRISVLDTSSIEPWNSEPEAEPSTLVTFKSGSGPDGLSIAPDGIIYVALAFARQLVAVDRNDAGTRTGGASVRQAPAVRVIYTPEPIASGPAAGPLACYDCAVEPGGRRIAVAVASANEELAERVATGRIVLLDLPPQ
ncbi:MAG: SMP-30/gluconolactonase/LRE family protein, partial [Salinibacterium sp.]|nr:SMP-30/gluconolactonase/LRE family protein [Salinibacterium sp.]